MKKLLPYAPMFALLIGTLVVQLSGQGSQGLLSSTLDASSLPQTGWYCTQPDHFIDTNETAWCHGSNPENIEKKYRSWEWLCVRGNEKQVCHFEETGPYKTRGGTFFQK